MDTKKLSEFLIEASRQIYANNNAKKTAPLRPSSYDYHYESGDLSYHDTYFGGKKFLGSEVVYYQSQPIWGMNYYGCTLGEELAEEAVDKLLRPALMKIGEDGTVLPVRGPREHTEGDCKYTFDSDGELSRFTGIEEILRGGEVIYRLWCHGGEIK